MTPDELQQLRYPIGPFSPPTGRPTREDVDAWIEAIRGFPMGLRAVVEPLDKDTLDTAYRPGGWTIRQVVHHLADSHMNSLVRFKWALTEEEPRIKAYWEDRWAELGDYRLDPGPSLDQLDATHRRWASLLGSMGEAEFRRGFVHPETDERVRLDVNTGIYAWHGRHHLAHITGVLERI